MKTKSPIAKKLKFLLAFVLLLLLVNTASATNLRGRLVRFYPQNGQYFPLANVQVNLWVLNPNNQWINLGHTFTDAYGFYYFNGVVPNYIFQIQVFGVFKLNPALTVMNVFPPYFQDIPQIAT